MSLRRVNNVFLADTARVLGEVELGEQVNVWYGAVIRADVAPITLGPRTNVQDNAIVHCDSDAPNQVGTDVTIGHSAIVHGVSVGDGSLVGMGAKLLGGTKVGRRCLIAAGAVLPPGLEVPDDHLVMGVPGRVVRETNDQEKKYLAWLARHYVQLAARHVEQSDAPEIRPWPSE